MVKAFEKRVSPLCINGFTNLNIYFTLEITLYGVKASINIYCLYVWRKVNGIKSSLLMIVECGQSGI